MDFSRAVRNILRGADASAGANAARAAQGATRRADVMGDVLLDNVGDILMRPEVLAELPADLASRVRLGDNAAMLEAMMQIMGRGNVPRNIPAGRMLTPPPGAEAGFVRGNAGGRVPVQSAGELIPAGPRDVLRYPGAEAGFQMGGSVPPQVFDATGMIPSPGRPSGLIPTGSPSMPRRQDGFNPLIPFGAGAAAGLGVAGAAKYLTDDAAEPSIDVFLDDVDNSAPEAAPGKAASPSVEVVPEESVPARPDENLPPVAAKKVSDPEASAVLRRMMPKTSGPSFKFGPNDPQARTYRALLDAGIEPQRALDIAQMRASMTQMEHDAVISNSGPRRQRERDAIQRRRDARMGAY